MFTTPDSVSSWGTVGAVCGVILILEALGIAIVLRNTTRRFWRRKFLIATAAIGASMCIAAWQAFGVYDTLRGRDPMLLTPSDISTITQWAGFGNLALLVTMVLLFVGAWYVWLARD
jgi:hypothetical protein